MKGRLIRIQGTCSGVKTAVGIAEWQLRPWGDRKIMY